MHLNFPARNLKSRHHCVSLETQLYRLSAARRVHLSSAPRRCTRPTYYRRAFLAVSTSRSTSPFPVLRARISASHSTANDAATAIAMSLPRRPLGRTGLDLSIVSFGASPLGSVFEEIDEEEGVRAVHEAVKLGINLFDVSPACHCHAAMPAGGGGYRYQVLGRAIATLPCPREEVVVATKVGRYGQDDFDFSADRIRRSVEESCARLQTPYLDIVQCHDIEFGSLDQVRDGQCRSGQKKRGGELFQAANAVSGHCSVLLPLLPCSHLTSLLPSIMPSNPLPPLSPFSSAPPHPQIVNETIPALQELKAAGKIRFIGITGLPLSVYQSVLPRLPPASLDLILSYCHYSLNDTTLQPLLPWLQQQGVGVISASPLSMGLLTPQGPPSWHPAPQELKVSGSMCPAPTLCHLY
ncbi:unnamed protein product [Closterium sp. NIES-53]